MVHSVRNDGVVSSSERPLEAFTKPLNIPIQDSIRFAGDEDEGLLTTIWNGIAYCVSAVWDFVRELYISCCGAEEPPPASLTEPTTPTLPTIPIYQEPLIGTEWAVDVIHRHIAMRPFLGEALFIDIIDAIMITVFEEQGYDFGPIFEELQSSGVFAQMTASNFDEYKDQMDRAPRNGVEANTIVSDEATAFLDNLGNDEKIEAIVFLLKTSYVFRGNTLSVLIHKILEIIHATEKIDRNHIVFPKIYHACTLVHARWAFKKQGYMLLGGLLALLPDEHSEYLNDKCSEPGIRLEKCILGCKVGLDSHIKKDSLFNALYLYDPELCLEMLRSSNIDKVWLLRVYLGMIVKPQLGCTKDDVARLYPHALAAVSDEVLTELGLNRGMNFEEAQRKCFRY